LPILQSEFGRKVEMYLGGAWGDLVAIDALKAQ